MKKKWTTDLAIKRITEKWGGKIIVPPAFKFVNVDSLTTFICAEHGEFVKSVYRVMNGKHPCSKWSPTGPKGWSYIKTKLEKKHGQRYDYHLNDSEYTPGNKIKIICKTHGVFEQRLGDHLAGGNCPKCVKEEKEVSVNDFLFDAIKHHGNTYGYNFIFEDYTKANEFVRILCKKHGIFRQRAGDHRRGAGCPHCNGSRGEAAVRSFLIRNKIEFIFQKTYPDLKSDKGWAYRYDYFIPEFNTLVEYDGKQHFEAGHLNEYNLSEVEETDRIKTQYAKENNIDLIRISDIEQIEIKLAKFVRNRC